MRNKIITGFVFIFTICSTNAYTSMKNIQRDIDINFYLKVDTNGKFDQASSYAEYKIQFSQKIDQAEKLKYVLGAADNNNKKLEPFTNLILSDNDTHTILTGTGRFNVDGSGYFMQGEGEELTVGGKKIFAIDPASILCNRVNQACIFKIIDNTSTFINTKIDPKYLKVKMLDDRGEELKTGEVLNVGTNNNLKFNYITPIKAFRNYYISLIYTEHEDYIAYPYYTIITYNLLSPFLKIKFE